MSTIDYSPLGKAIARLQEGLESLAREPGNTLYRDGVILRFRIAFDMSVGTLQHLIPIKESVAPVTFEGFIRNARSSGVLQSDCEMWLKFQEARSLSSLAYSEEIADKVVAEIPRFSREAEILYSGMQR